MRVLVLGLALVVALVSLPLQRQAQAAAQFVAWPAQFSYGTPSGALTWNTTALGLRFHSSMVPFLGFGTDFYYGGVSNLSLGGSPLSGFTGQTLAGDVSLRFGTGAGPVSFTAFAGYEALALNASGPATTDRVVLLTSGVRVGGEARVALSRGFALKGSYTVLTGLNSSANLAITSPLIAAQYNGTGNGTEYELVLSYSFIPRTSVYMGYRSGTYQTNWTGFGSTTTSFNGIILGLETGF